jgi:hypothetical protein
VAADFHHDGMPDIAGTDSFAQKVTILLGQSHGAFKQARFLGEPAMNPVASSPNRCGEHLPPGKSCTVTVDLQPPEKGKRSAVLVFIDNGLRGKQTTPMAGTVQ